MVTIRGRASVCLQVLILTAAMGGGAAQAQAVRNDDNPLAALSRFSARLSAQEALEPLASAEGTLKSRALADGWAAFRLSAEGDWQALVDRRTGLVSVAEGGGIPWIPGRANRLTVADVPALAGREKSDLAAMESIARSFLPRVAPLLGVSPADLQLDLGRSGQPADHVWFVDFDVSAGKQVIEGARVVFRVNNGNLIQFGTENLPSPGAKPPAVKLSREDALTVLEDAVGGLDLRDKLVDAGSLHLLPAGVTDVRSADGFAPGQGRGLVQVWELAFRREGVMGTWRARIDATTGELLELADANAYAYAHVNGGVYPVSPTQTPETVRPLPFVDLSIGGFVNSAGTYVPCCGTSTTHLSGQYVRIADTCGAISKTATTQGDIFFGTSTGTDCRTPGTGGAGNTHASRTQYYHVNRAKEMGRGWLPGNAWLNQQLTVNVNLNQLCNAYWDGATLNFFKSGGGCGNTGEIAGISLHEYGHGLDDNDGTVPEGSTGEAYGDWTAALALHSSCIGPGFYQTGICTGYGDACTACSGVRDIDWAKHASNTPATAANFIQPNCDPGGGLCGREYHCEAYVPTQAMWDFVNRDLPGPGGVPAWTVAERLWYLSRSTSTSAFTCNTAGPAFTSDGCGAGSWWRTMRAVDDDDGNLGNGTPHSCSLYAAFNRHGIACPSDAGASTCFSGCTPPAAPAVSLTAGNDQVTVQVSGTGPFDIYRNEAGCNAGFVKVASGNTSGSLLDNDVANGTTYYYKAVAHPSGNEACSSAASTCQSVPLCTSPSVSLSCSGNFRGSTQITCFANAAGGVPPYTYTWSYSGSASSWSSSGSSATAFYNSPGCGVSGFAFNRFVIEVRDSSCPQPGIASISPLSCN